MSAGEAHPGGLHTGDKELILFQQIREAAEPVAVDFFDLRDHLERGGDPRKSLFLCLFCKMKIDIVVFFILIVLGQT